MKSKTILRPINQGNKNQKLSMPKVIDGYTKKWLTFNRNGIVLIECDKVDHIRWIIKWQAHNFCTCIGIYKTFQIIYVAMCFMLKFYMIEIVILRKIEIILQHKKNWTSYYYMIVLQDIPKFSNNNDHGYHSVHHYQPKDLYHEKSFSEMLWIQFSLDFSHKTLCMRFI